jgi:methionyl-tRNA formyltransferase
VRLAFFGTPAPAVPVLRAVHAAGHDVALVVTQPPRRRGRGAGSSPSPVHAAALDLHLPVRTPDRAREVVDELRAAGVDAGVVAAFGQLLPPAVLAAVPGGLLNVHLSLLPRWRGAAPVERAILAGDAETGVSIMRIDEGLDTGPVYRTVATPVGADETAGELTARLVDLGVPPLLDVLAHLADLEPAAQVGAPTYAEKLTVDEFHLDPGRAAADLARVVRAGNPRPGAWLRVDGARVKVLRAHAEGGQSAAGTLMWPGAELGTEDGLLVLDEVQVEGKRPMAGDAWLAGFRKRHLTLPVE